ncbi:MAG: undecaprenyl/decaprenyl-phosphate alpha-N-acetylglucosaminyl 1-phosphate transferase [Candidatus Omnitrophica bacterium]|nr:undecaprenyl/decaprenyl-phosphate alpha-N-acetylglucosaminyl 1-phosphate transferase [Candidatus Omnitrophota bacterium]
MLIKFLSTILSSFLSSVIFIVIFRKISLRYNILVLRGIPLIGGLALGITFILGCITAFSIYIPQKVQGIILASVIMLIFGLIDDWKELSVTAKFLVQIIATFFLVLFNIRTHIIYIGNIANIIVTFIWVIGITNAINHLDVVDGLAGGVVFIAALAFFIIAFLNNDIKIIFMSLALIGAILGFLIYNFPPAKIYMGNCGSHFLGFILAAIALSISYANSERTLALLSPLLILGLPIFDTAFLIVVRISQGKSAFRKSEDHLALRFLKLGYSKEKTLLFMLLLSSVFSFSGILISRVSNNFGIAIIIFVGFLSLIVAKKMNFKI